ncbi:MAG TPA: translocation/assembly module TamB domain-containing protein [Bryobacteraceae bacterium]
MSRGRKIALIVGGSLAALVLVVVISGIAIVQTDWFRNFVRTKIVTAVEEATGAKAEIGSFAFDWRHLRADVRNFVLHGLESPQDSPLFRADHLQVDLKLLSPFKGFVDIAYLLVDTPRANIIVYADGHTNIPAPKVKKPSDKSGLETIVDLAIGRFDLLNAGASYADRKSAMNASGQDLRAHLAYNHLNPSYTGEIDWSQLFLKTENNPPLKVDIKLPLTLEKDKITLANAQVNTPESQIVVSGSIDHLAAPRTAAHLNARLAIDEVKRAAGLTMPLDTRHGPGIVNADVIASVDENNRIRVQSAHINLGQSNIEASGPPNDVQFNSTLVLGEIGKLLRVAARPEGTVKIGGNAKLDANNNYSVTAKVDARNVAVQQGTTRLSGISLDSNVTADPHRIALADLRLGALGGSFTGSGTLEEMAQFRVSGNLHNFDIDQMTRAFMTSRLGYDGIISGPVEAQGNIKNSSAVVAHTALTIAPGRRGVPVSGRLNADYNGRADTVVLGKSYVALPHTRVDLSGALGQAIQVQVVSHNLSDLQPLGNIPITLNNGTATVNATITGSISAPKITAQAGVTNFAAEGRSFDRFSADLAASKSGAAVSNGTLARGALQAQFSGTVGLRDWKPQPALPLRADATVRNADVQDVLALAGQADVPVTGALTVDAHIDGTVGSPRGNADLTVANGTAEGEHFDSLVAHANMTDTAIDIPTLHWTAGPSRIDATANFQHPVNDLTRGSLRAHVASNQVQIAQFQSLVKDRPGLQGTLSLNGDAAATMQPAGASTDFELTSLNANISARSLQMEGKKLGDLTATATSSGSNIQYNVNSDFAGSTIRVTGQSLLAGDHQTTANASIANLPIEQVLAVAGRRDLPVTGTLGATAQVSGTLQNPQANASLDITKGAAYQEPFDRLQTTIHYTSQSIEVPNFRVDAGRAFVELTASLTHPAGDLENGQARFHVRSNDLEVSRFHNVKQAQPGLAGVVQLAADGAATLRKDQAPLFSELNANVAAKGLSMNQKPLGDLTATAATQGNAVALNLTSDLGHANIRGTGHMQLGGDNPLDARLNFSNVTYSGLSPILGSGSQPFDASLEGQVSVSGPLARTEDLRGTLQLSKLEAHSVSGAAGRKPRVTFELHNAAPVVAALDRSVVTIQSAHITGPFTDLSLSGTAALNGKKTMSLRADGSVKLELLEAFDADIFSAGNIALNAVVTGTTDKPQVNGRLQLQNASFNMLNLPNGISNGNGLINFTGTEAVIQNLTGETGGGKVTLTGFAAYGGPELQFRLQANANQVRVEASDSLTAEANAQATLTGSSSRSLLSGTVTILGIAMHSHSDVGSMLASAAAPPPTASATTGPLAGMRFDVKIQTAPNLQVRTSLTKDLHAEANLTLRGGIDHPGMLGRVVVTQGEVIFFGTKYDIDQGTVSFFNPQKIDPILNIDLETSVQGVDVSLSVSGPVSRMKLSYRSDPPMLFSDLVSLLASGKLSTTDPVLAARQPTAPQQSFEQMGASTVLSQAVANPVSGRLQRLFGVSALKIDPQITGSSSTPSATLTLQQQVTRDVTFTYISDVTQSNPQIIRIEWAINPQWSAIAQRDVNGIFDLDFFYKKRFH